MGILIKFMHSWHVEECVKAGDTIPTALLGGGGAYHCCQALIEWGQTSIRCWCFCFALHLHISLCFHRAPCLQMVIQTLSNPQHCQRMSELSLVVVFFSWRVEGPRAGWGFVEGGASPRYWTTSTWDSPAMHSKTCLNSDLLYSRVHLDATRIWIKSRTPGYSWPAGAGAF